MNGGGSSSSSTTTPNFDNLLLQSLMSRLQLRPPTPTPFSDTKSLEDLLFSDLLLNLSDDDSDVSDDDDENSIYSSKTQLAKEESKLEKEIVRTILSGEIDKLKPNSGQAITVGEHHICVGFQHEVDSDYRVWEWHGHIMLFDEENGYAPEYIYGNYFEWLGAGKRELLKQQQQILEKIEKAKEKEEEEEEEEEEVGNLGLKELTELIGTVEPESGRILHRHLNANTGLARLLD